MEENLQQLESTYGAPASLFERSAAARAKASGSTTEAVVAQWVGKAELPVGESPVGESPVASRQSPVEGEDAPAPAASAVSGMSGPALLAAVAEARGMPVSLIERSAKARASAVGGSVEDVLQEWAAEEGLSEAKSPVAGRRSPVEEAGSPFEDAPVPAAGALTGAALLAAVAEARGMPESLIERSASARAKTAGVGVDDVLRDWAEEEGLDVAPAGEAEAPAEESESPVVPPAGGRGDAEERSDDAGGSVAASGGLTGGALLSAVAAARKMPESLVERSAKARAKREGGSVEDVLLEWAKEEGLDASAPVAGAAPSSVPPAEGRGNAGGPSSSAPASGGLTGGALLSAVAAARKMPESLVERSAKARAKREGGSVEDVLLEWAAEEGVVLSPVEEPSSPAAESRDFVAATDQPEDIEEFSDATAADAAALPRAEIPSPPVIEPVEEPEPEEPESPRSRYPAWLAAVLVVIPLLAVLYLVVVPNQPTCGSAGQLAIDPATGVAVGCDGGEYGVDDVSNFSIGATVYEESCAVCHGADGGGGAGPAMAGGALLGAFPETACGNQIEWVSLGSSNWPDATYGANGKPVAGGMPGFEGQLTELEIAQVVLFERVEFGGLDLVTAEPACGFTSEEAG